MNSSLGDLSKNMNVGMLDDIYNYTNLRIIKIARDT